MEMTLLWGCVTLIGVGNEYVLHILGV